MSCMSCYGYQVLGLLASTYVTFYQLMNNKDIWKNKGFKAIWNWIASLLAITLLCRHKTCDLNDSPIVIVSNVNSVRSDKFEMIIINFIYICMVVSRTHNLTRLAVYGSDAELTRLVHTIFFSEHSLTYI
jgi:hypothetical protein